MPPSLPPSVRTMPRQLRVVARAWKIQLSMKLDDDDLEAGDDADTDNNHPLSSGSKKRKLWKQHYVIEAEQVGESAGTVGCTHMISATNCSTSRARSLATSISTQLQVNASSHVTYAASPSTTSTKYLTEHKRLQSSEKPFECFEYFQHMNHYYKYCKP